MIRLALRSLRADPTRFAATFVTIALSTAVTASFATLAETAIGPMSALDREILVIMGGVIGGWGAIIGTFAPVSTLAMIVERRAPEMALIRRVGATPTQATRLVQLETLVVAIAAVLVGVAAARPLGRMLFDILQDGDMVAATVDHRAGLLSLGGTAVAMVGLAVGAATIASWRVARRSLGAPRSADGSLPLWRIVTGGTLIGFGGSGALSGLVMSQFSDDPYLAMQISGPAGLLAAAGGATLAPALLARTGDLTRRMARDAVGRLAAGNVSGRPSLMSPVLGPVLLLMAGATGTLMLVGIDARTAVEHGGSDAQAESLVLLNTAVAAMISIFTAILAVNAQNAMITGRASEFARLGLAGATPAQLRALVTRESLMVGVLGAAGGAVCSLLTILPMSLARGEGFVPNGLLWLPAALFAAVVAITVVSGRVALAASRRAEGSRA